MFLDKSITPPAGNSRGYGGTYPQILEKTGPKSSLCFVIVRLLKG